MQTRILGRGETPWSDAIASELRALELGGLIVLDLGTRAGPIVPGVPTVIVDHHVPIGVPDQATLISAHAFAPIPTTSLAALGLVGDMAEKAGFPELEEARQRYGS